MCEYAVRKHSNSTGRVPRRLGLRAGRERSLSALECGGWWLARRSGGRERVAREGARSALDRLLFVPGELFGEGLEASPGRLGERFSGRGGRLEKHT